MAHQHFYSRVPARVSLYNKIDSFDTFAHSAGLSKEFILDELACVYSDKLDIYDSMKLRRGEIPTVYSQLTLPSGKTAHTAIGYLPLDFTEERSSYLAHTLILDENESSAVFSGNESCVFNKDMFITDISSFDITASNAAANPALPEKAYFLRPLFDPRSLTFKYNKDMMKSFLYSVIASVCGSGRTVYFRLPTENLQHSNESLNFINSVMSILPYSVRKRLSFVTYVSETESYKGFNLKGVSEDVESIDSREGSFYDFSRGMVTGQPAEYSRHLSLASFFYALFENKNVRDEFHAFVSRIEKSYSYLTLDVKTLSEIVFVFWQCSGFYVENSVLPNDDTVKSFFDIYEKYKLGLTSEQRVKAYRCLSRYSKAQIAIPRGIFEKLLKLYPEECTPAKAVALDVMLSLIHAPAMREELFAFITRHYAGEIDKVKEVINNNLSRVFYGGFLQHHILRFFDTNFASEPESTKNIIVDKLILSIRTPDMRAQIVSFFDRHYRDLSAAHRFKIFTTAIEMIPECDDLSALLIGFVNRHVLTESEEIRALMIERLPEALDRNIRFGNGNMVALLMENPGFCESIATNHIWKYRVGGDQFIGYLASLPAHKRALKLISMYKTLPDLTNEDYELLVSTFSEIDVEIRPSTMYDLISADGNATMNLPKEQAELIKKLIIHPTITSTFLDVFNVKYGKDGINTLLRYADGKPSLTNSEQYKFVQQFITLTERCERGDTENTFRIALELTDDPELREEIAEYISDCVINTATQSDVCVCTFELLVGYYQTGGFDLEELYTRYKKELEDKYISEGGVRNMVDPPERRAAIEAMELTLFCISEISAADSTLSSIICHFATGITKVLEDFIVSFGVGAWVFLKMKAKGCPDVLFERAEAFIKDRYTSVDSVDDVLDIILRRK